MTGVGQRMPLQQAMRALETSLQQAIILRSSQPTSTVTLPRSHQVRQQVNAQPILVGGHPILGPVLSTQTSPLLAGGRNLIINMSGSQISVPLDAVQSLQAGKFSSFASSAICIMNKIYYVLQAKEYLLDKLVNFLSKQKRENTKLSIMPPGRLPLRGFLSARPSQCPILCLVPPQAHRHPKQLHLSLQPKVLGVKGVTR